MECNFSIVVYGKGNWPFFFFQEKILYMLYQTETGSKVTSLDVFLSNNVHQGIAQICRVILSFKEAAPGRGTALAGLSPWSCLGALLPFIGIKHLTQN